MYIDKNCEKAWIQQCQPSLWKQQFAKLLQWKIKLNVKYINKSNVNELKSIEPTSPILVILKDKLSYFGQAAAQISSQWKLVNGNYYLPLSGWTPLQQNLCNVDKDTNWDWLTWANDPTCYSMTVLTSKKCTEPYCSAQAYNNMFMWYHVNVVYYNTPDGKKLYSELVKKNGSQTLPTFLFTKKHSYVKAKQFENFVKTVNLSEWKYQINIPEFKYDPSIEACANNCNASPACKKLLSCNKTDKPNVELFVMAYCPFGTQAEKWIIPVVNLLWNKIDFKIRFTNYDMHPNEWSVQEDLLQHCIQKVQSKKYISYLTCFLNNHDTKWCESKTKLDMKKVNECVKADDIKYNIENNFKNKSSWVSWRFPKVMIDNDLDVKYWVQWSPTLVINWITVQPNSRSPQSYLNAICNAFKVKPAVCNKKIDNKPYDPSFWWTQSWKAVPAGSCGK